MNDKSDAQLLREFAECADEAAFREIVTRHTDFVYSAALRQVESSAIAGDLAQNVFTDLARKAKPVAEKITGDSSLAGWLHRSTRYAALNHLRDSRRRRENERQAMEQLLTNSESPAGWEQIRPALDEALDSLANEDREALLLRYFKNHDFRAVGLALGVSDDTAQKRVSRAVERLREFFEKRKVIIGTGGLVAVISANAMQAAPVGLAVTISAAAIAGTAATTSTIIATTKIIAMTTLQKTVITAAFVAAAGAGIFEARQAAQLREQNQTLQQSQAPLAEQIQQLQSDFTDATNRLANLLTENTRLKSNPHENELLKLRGQVGLLRQQLAFIQAKINLPSSGLEKIMADPAMKDLMDQQARREITLRYADLFRELKLSPEQIKKFALTYANSGLEQTDVEGQLRSLLGDDGYARFKEFTQEVPARTTVKLLNSQLGANELTDEQGTRLLQIVRAEPYDLTYGIEGDLNEALFGTQDQVDNYVGQVAASNQHVVQQAGAFLAPDQLAALNTVLTNALNMRIAQAAALVQKH